LGAGRPFTIPLFFPPLRKAVWDMRRRLENPRRKAQNFNAGIAATLCIVEKWHIVKKRRKDE
jgi:hypothetical protein